MVVNDPVDKALISAREGVVAFGGVPFDSHDNLSIDSLSLCCFGGVLLGSFSCVKWMFFVAYSMIYIIIYIYTYYHMKIHKIY